MRRFGVGRVEEPGKNVAVQSPELVPGKVRRAAADPQRLVDDQARGLGGAILQARQEREPPRAVVGLSGEIVGEGEWEPIVSGELFDSVGRRLADPARKTNRTAPQ